MKSRGILMTKWAFETRNVYQLYIFQLWTHLTSFQWVYKPRTPLKIFFKRVIPSKILEFLCTVCQFLKDKFPLHTYIYAVYPPKIDTLYRFWCLQSLFGSNFLKTFHFIRHNSTFDICIFKKKKQFLRSYLNTVSIEL